MTIQFDEEGFALESGEVTVYFTDDLGIYTHSGTEFVSIGTGLSAGAYLEQPPVFKRGFAIVRDNDSWLYQPDYRGKTVYHTQTQVSKNITELGDIPPAFTLVKPPDAYHNWDGERWVFKESNLAQKIRDKKAEKLKEINAKAQDFVRKAAGFDDVPDYEIKTWQMQGAEAKAWKLNQSAPTPTLDLIAQTRGVPADILKQKAYEKTIKFERLTAFIAGKRQGYEDANKAAKTLDDIEKINPIYSVGG